MYVNRLCGVCQGERYAGITFNNWSHISPAEFTRKQEKVYFVLRGEGSPKKAKGTNGTVFLAEFAARVSSV